MTRCLTRRPSAVSRSQPSQNDGTILKERAHALSLCLEAAIWKTRLRSNLGTFCRNTGRHLGNRGIQDPKDANWDLIPITILSFEAKKRKLMITTAMEPRWITAPSTASSPNVKDRWNRNTCISEPDNIHLSEHILLALHRRCGREVQRNVQAARFYMWWTLKT